MKSPPWVLMVVASVILVAILMIAWTWFKESSIWDRARESAERHIKVARKQEVPPGPIIGAYACMPVDRGWVNCDCMPKAITPTVYDQVTVVRCIDIGGELHPDWRPALRCRSCGRVYLPAEISEIAKGLLK